VVPPHAKEHFIQIPQDVGGLWNIKVALHLANLLVASNDPFSLIEMNVVCVRSIWSKANIVYYLSVCILLIFAMIQ